MTRFFLVLFILFVVLPFVELALLLKLADLTNWKVSLLVVVVTGVAGALLIRNFGWLTYRRIQTELDAGRVPADALLDALFIFVAGVLLLTPGMLTDVLAILFLIPLTRHGFKWLLLRWIKSHFRLQSFTAAGAATEERSRIVDSYVVHRDDAEDES
jgi:UPF0716 protein FxsA